MELNGLGLVAKDAAILRQRCKHNHFWVDLRNASAPFTGQKIQFPTGSKSRKWGYTGIEP